jgi:phosphoglycolate phosphatase
LSDDRFPDRRLFLFDIDGTLINTGGAGSAAMRAAFATLYGVEDAFRGIEFTGRSDLAIIQDALILAKVAADGSLAEALKRFKRGYYRQLPLTLVKSQGRVLPGVDGLLQALSQDQSATVWLGTGNFRNSAGIKLRYYGLWHYFKGGGFGDRTSERALLIAQGIRAANRRAGRHGTVFVIGDTVHDIAAAKANRAVAVGVATGTTPASDLEAAGADLVLESLEGAIIHFARPD